MKIVIIINLDDDSVMSRTELYRHITDTFEQMSFRTSIFKRINNDLEISIKKEI